MTSMRKWGPGKAVAFAGVLTWALACGEAPAGSAQAALDGPPGIRPAILDTILDRGDAVLRVRRLGEGPPVVLVHGGPGLDHSYFLPGMEEAAREFTLVFYDQRGSGGSDAPLDSASISMENFLADLGSVIEMARSGNRGRSGGESSKVTVLGHSFGAYLALRFAQVHPSALHGLILMNPVEPGRRFAEETAAAQRSRQTEEDARELAELFESAGFRAREPESLESMLRIAFRSTFARRERVEDLRLELSPATARALVAVPSLLMGPLGAYDHWDDLHRISVPTLVIHGAVDPTPSEMVRELCDAIPRCHLVFLQDAGHFPWIEAPEATFQALEAFMESVTGGN